MSAAVIGRMAAPHLHVMTFNVRRRIDGPTWPPADRWKVRSPRVERLLRTEQPTLVGVQEALPDQALLMRTALGESYRSVGRGRGREGRGEGCPIVFDDARLELLDSAQLALSDTPGVTGSRSWGNQVPRILVEAVFRDRATSAQFTVVNTHLDVFSRRARVRGAEMVRQRVTASARPAIVLGDLNAPPDSPPARELLSAGTLRDAWWVALSRATPEWGTRPGYRQPRIGGPRIDWIAVTADIRVERVAVNARTVLGGRPSDHFPMQAVLRLGIGEGP